MMKRLLALVVLGLLVHSVPASAQVFTQHFQCYAILKADPVPVLEVELLDQFDDPEKVEVVRARRFCNPAGKFHRNEYSPLTDVRQHLTMYATFPQSAPLRIVTLSNQFNRVGTPSQVWRLREAVALAVPTHKPPHEAPKGLDHFRCYAASGNPVGEPIALLDQFVRVSSHFVLDPVLFCNPVRKTLPSGEVTPVEHPEEHLACYSMTRVRFSTSRDVENQFGRQTFQIGPSDTVCVPTRKISWTVIPDTIVGTGGAADSEP